MTDESGPKAASHKTELAVAGEARRSKKENFKDYFDLQYDAARIISERKKIPFEDALFLFTTFFKHFGLASVDGKTDPSNPQWQRYVDGLKEHKDDPFEYTYNFYLELPPKMPKPIEQRFGCFNFDAPDEKGTIYIHFTNADRDGQGPLSSSKMDRRKGELRDMFTYVKQTYPDAKFAEGGSWLYSREEYRRLFPTSFGESRIPVVQNERIQHSGYWGQVQDHNGSVKPDVAAQLLEKLKQIDPERIGEAFPHVPYRTKAPIEDFYAFYGIE